jgi:hypothetical protein
VHYRGAGIATTVRQVRLILVHPRNSGKSLAQLR